MMERKQTSIRYRSSKDKLVFVLVCALSALSMLPLFFILWEVISRGYKNFNLQLFSEVTPSSMDAMLSRINGESIPGGILNGITGTLLIVGVAILLT
ncbi:MAG TPA: phosphate ABC transporter, permease protein PstA, partial [Porphyromonadaceae bacterium]|nr:phosphate ABC transporter, permease protein PstA [Porphyromonadaceae bacterium]